MNALLVIGGPLGFFISASPSPSTYIPIIIALVAIVPGTLAYMSGRKQESSKATREDFNALRLAYREDNEELRVKLVEMEDERDEWRERIRSVEKNEEVCTRRLSWLLGKLNIPLSDLDKGMNGEPINIKRLD